MFATRNLNTRATDDLAVRDRGFKVEAEIEVYILLNLIGPKCDPALGHGHHTTGMTSPAYGKGTFHLYLVNQRKLTEFIICGPFFHLSVRLFTVFF